MSALAPTTTPAGEYVRKLRNDYGDTQVEFAARIGSTQPTVSRVEDGAGPYREGLSQGFAWKLVTRLGVDANEVAGYVAIPGWMCLPSITALTDAVRRTFVPFSAHPLAHSA